MQLFTVPQFIDAEDKIIGPITVRQFIICLAGMAFIGIGWKLFDLSLFIVWGLVNFAVFGSLAFVKINGRPFHYFVLNFIQTSKKPRLRVWNHKNPLKDAVSAEDDKGEGVHAAAKFIPVKPRPAGSRLRELALIADTKGQYKGGEDEEIIG
jgi:hypothetical protein